MRHLLCCLLIALSGSAGAAPLAGPVETTDVVQAPGLLAERLITRAEAAAIAEKAAGGRVLAVHLVGVGPEAHWRVRLLVGGQVRIVRVDAHDGRLLR